MARRAILLTLLVAGISAFVWSTIHSAQDPQAEYAAARKANADHQEAFHQWRQALHSDLFRTPFYQASVNILICTKGIEFARHCDSCHNPMGVLSGALNPVAQGDRSFDRDGLTCTVCHSIQKVDTKLGNGSFTLGVPAVMVDEQAKRIPCVVPDSEILAHLDRHTNAVMQDIYKTPEFCSACHKANFPVSLNSYEWIHAFTSYNEWQNSKFSQRNSLTFYFANFTTCQNCHMKRGATGALPKPGAKHGTFASHRWPTGNTAGHSTMASMSRWPRRSSFKKRQLSERDIFGLKINGHDTLVAPLGMAPLRSSRRLARSLCCGPE